VTRQDTKFRDMPLRWAYVRAGMLIRFPFLKGMGVREGLRLAWQAGIEMGDLTPNEVIAMCMAAERAEASK
jgi:hypothetical protein